MILTLNAVFAIWRVKKRKDVVFKTFAYLVELVDTVASKAIVHMNMWVQVPQ